MVAGPRMPEPGRNRHYRGRPMRDGRAARRRRPTSTSVLVLGVLMALAVALGAGCSGSGGGGPLAAITGGDSGASTRQTCALIRQLSDAAKPVLAAPNNDPAKADAALEAGVRQYATTLDRIAARVPDALRHQIELLRSAVEQYKFKAAIDARAPLDDWAAEHCS